MMLVAGFGWARPIPVNPNYFKKPRQGMALTALAGPVSNVVLAYVAVVILNFLFFWLDNFGGGWLLMAHAVFYLCGDHQRGELGNKASPMVTMEYF